MHRMQWLMSSLQHTACWQIMCSVPLHLVLSGRCLEYNMDLYAHNVILEAFLWLGFWWLHTILLVLILQFANEYTLCCGLLIFISSLLCAHSLLQCALPFSSHVSFPGWYVCWPFSPSFLSGIYFFGELSCCLTVCIQASVLLVGFLMFSVRLSGWSFIFNKREC
jgi:hypothetical protein